MAYLLDTNFVSDLVRHPNGIVAQRIAERRHENIVTSIIAAAELRFGAARNASPRLITQVEAVLNGIETLPFSYPADRCYAEIRSDLERRGTLIGPNDLLIAAQTLALGFILVTDNHREFSRVEGLTIENWLR